MHLLVFTLWSFFQSSTLLAEKPINLKISVPFPENSPEAAFWLEAAKKWKKQSIDIEWSWLQVEKISLESLAKEKTDGVILIGPALVALSKTFSEVERPYAYATKDEADKFLQKNNSVITSELENYGVCPWVRFYVGEVYLYGRKNFEKDYKGAKIWQWGQNSPFKDWIIEKKAVVVLANSQQVLEKLEKGEIDLVYGLETAVERMRWQKVASFKSQKPIAHAFGYLLLRTKLYATLPKSSKNLKF